MRCHLVLACVVAAMVLGCLHAPVEERLSLHNGETLEGPAQLEKDVFLLEDGTRVPRREVESIHFQTAGREALEGTGALASGGLTPLAQGLLARGQALGQAYPGVPGVILVDDGEFVYRDDGTSTYRYHFAGLVLKEDAKGWAQVSVGFTEGRSRVTVLFGRSVAPDGTVESIAPDALQVGAPSQEMAFFNPNRKVLSGLIPGLDVGSVVEYAYESERYNPDDPRLFSPGYFFQSGYPVVLSRARVTVPKDTPFHHVTHNFPNGVSGEPLVENVDGNTVFTWLLEDVPPLPQEPQMPPERDLVPMMSSSIFRDWDEVFAFEAALQERRIALTPEIEVQVEAITRGAASVEEKLARLYHWLQTNTRYVSIKGSLGSGMSGHTAQETFENRYGDCTDKAILFATMCQAIGVECYPITLLTNVTGQAVTEIPTIDGNHCINEVVLDGRSFYLDTTAQNFRYPYFRPDDHGATAMNAIRGDLRTIPVPDPSDNSRVSRLTLSLNADGDLKVQTSNEYTGTIEAGIRGYWKTVREDNRRLRMSEYVNSISPGGVLEDFTLSDLDDLSQQLTMAIDYALPRHAVRAKDLMYLRVPTLEREYTEVALDTRQFPIQYMTSEQRILEVDLRLPKGYRTKWLPPPLSFSSPYLEFDAAYEDHGDRVSYHETFRRLKRIVPVEDCPAYRDALRAIAAFSKKEIFLIQGD